MQSSSSSLSSTSSYKMQASSDARARDYYHESSNYQNGSGGALYSSNEAASPSVAHQQQHYSNERIVPIQFHRSTPVQSTTTQSVDFVAQSGAGASSSGLGAPSRQLSHRRSSRMGDENNIGELNDIFQKMYTRHRNSVFASSSSEIEHSTSAAARRYSYSSLINRL